MSTASKITFFMKKCGISQNELARLTRLSQSGLSSIINGNVSPRIDTLSAIAHVLNVSICDLLPNDTVHDKSSIDADPALNYPVLTDCMRINTLQIKQLRIENGFTQQDVADALNISRVAYTNIENCRRDPDTKTLIKLSDIFNVSLDAMFGRDPVNVEVKYTFNTRLKELRKSKGLTQLQLANIIGVTQAAIGKYEGNELILPSDDIKIKLADYFNVSIDYLLGRSNNPLPADFTLSEDESKLIDIFRSANATGKRTIVDLSVALIANPDLQEKAP